MITFSANQKYRTQFDNLSSLEDLRRRLKSNLGNVETDVDLIGQIYHSQATGKRKDKIRHLESYVRATQNYIKANNAKEEERSKELAKQIDGQNGVSGSFVTDEYLDGLDEETESVVKVFATLVNYIEEQEGENLINLSNHLSSLIKSGSDDEVALKNVLMKIKGLFTAYKDLNELPLEQIMGDQESVQRAFVCIKDDDKYDAFTLEGWFRFIAEKQLGDVIGLKS